MSEEMEGETEEPGPSPDVPAPISESREEILKQCFQRLDRNRSGAIELNDLRYYANKISPATNLHAATQLFEFLDADGDRQVTLDEYLTTMTMLTTMMTDDEFYTMFSEALAAESSAATGTLLVDGPRLDNAYVHPQSSCAYLEKKVMPLLRKGMEQLVKEIELDCQKLAAGSEWEEGQYLPPNWTPFSPLRWLADWLQQRVDRAKPLRWASSKEAQPLRTFQDLGREEKIALAFDHLDRDSSGWLDISELLALAGRVRQDVDIENAEEILALMDADNDGSVNLQEFTERFMKLTADIDDDAFDEAIRSMLSAGHLSYCTSREEKLVFLFNQIDLDHSGQVSFSEMAQLARRIDPSADDDKVAATMAAMGGMSGGDPDEIKNQQIQQDVFVAAIDAMLCDYTESDALDGVIVRLLEAHHAGPGAHDYADEVQPDELAALVRSLSSHWQAPQVSGTEVMDKIYQQAPMLLVDVRSQEEQAVSWISGAFCYPCKADANMPHGWSLPPGPPLTAIKSHLATLRLQHGQAAQLFVATYCNTGERGGAAALLLKAALGGEMVYNLCGGVINYYNQGGNVSDPATGKPVQAVHPGNVDLQAYITRPNKYKL